MDYHDCEPTTTGFAWHFGTGNPCPVCGRTSGDCKLTGHGLVICRDADNGSRAELRGFAFLGQCPRNAAFGMYRPPGTAGLPYNPDFDPELARQEHARAQAEKLEAWSGRVEMHLLGALPYPRSGRDLARRLSLPFDAGVFGELGTRYLSDNGFRGRPSWAFPLIDRVDQVVGWSLRTPGDFKFTVGSADGIFVPARVRDLYPTPAGLNQPLFVVEGASCTLALTLGNLFAVGRPSNVGGTEVLAAWVAGHLPRNQWDMVVVGENDAHHDKQGKRIWPGRDGALVTAHRLADLLGVCVRFAMPPAGVDGAKVKDCRDYFVSQLRRRGATPGNVGVRLCSELLEEGRVEVIRPDRPYRSRPIPAGVLPLREGEDRLLDGPEDRPALAVVAAEDTGAVTAGAGEHREANAAGDPAGEPVPGPSLQERALAILPGLPQAPPACACPHSPTVELQHREKPDHYRIARFACDRWDEEVCRRRKARSWAVHLACCILKAVEAGKVLCRALVGLARWGTFRKLLSNRKADRAALRSSELTDAGEVLVLFALRPEQQPPEGSVSIAPEEAGRLLVEWAKTVRVEREPIEGEEGWTPFGDLNRFGKKKRRSHPVMTSRPWALPKREASGKWERLAHFGPCDLDFVHRVVEQEGARVKANRRGEPGSSFIGNVDYQADDEQVRRIHDRLVEAASPVATRAACSPVATG